MILMVNAHPDQHDPIVSSVSSVDAALSRYVPSIKKGRAYSQNCLQNSDKTTTDASTVPSNLRVDHKDTTRKSYLLAEDPSDT